MPNGALENLWDDLVKTVRNLGMWAAALGAMAADKVDAQTPEDIGNTNPQYSDFDLASADPIEKEQRERSLQNFRRGITVSEVYAGGWGHSSHSLVETKDSWNEEETHNLSIYTVFGISDNDAKTLIESWDKGKEVLRKLEEFQAEFDRISGEIDLVLEAAISKEMISQTFEIVEKMSQSGGFRTLVSENAEGEFSVLKRTILALYGETGGDNWHKQLELRSAAGFSSEDEQVVAKARQGYQRLEKAHDNLLNAIQWAAKSTIDRTDANNFLISEDLRAGVVLPQNADTPLRAKFRELQDEYVALKGALAAFPSIGWKMLARMNDVVSDLQKPRELGEGLKRSGKLWEMDRGTIIDPQIVPGKYRWTAQEIIEGLERVGYEAVVFCPDTVKLTKESQGVSSAHTENGAVKIRASFDQLQSLWANVVIPAGDQVVELVWMTGSPIEMGLKDGEPRDFLYIPSTKQKIPVPEVDENGGFRVKLQLNKEFDGNLIFGLNGRQYDISFHMIIGSK